MIPKDDNPTSFEKFRPISLCNCIYKIISKVIARRLKRVLSRKISNEQFGFLEGRKIHEAIDIAQEGIHSIKVNNQISMVVKVDLSKAYDRVKWLYLRLILIHLGFSHQFVVWVMNCITFASFVIVINGVAYPLFRPGRGLRQGYPLSPLLFLLIWENYIIIIAYINYRIWVCKLMKC
jgi:hypothetical protein